MNNNITFFKVRFTLDSPLAVGSGENANTDSDVILDSRNNPIIPASSIAGIIHHFLEDTGRCSDELWGTTENGKGIPSKIKFYDAVTTVTDDFITVRDSVALENKIESEISGNETANNKVSVQGAKFDKEAVESGADFVTLIELDKITEDEKTSILCALSAIDSGYLRLGSKSTRGYGKLKITALKEAFFSLPDDRKKWLDFDQYNYDADDCYTDITDKLSEYSAEKYYSKITLNLKQKGALSIRSYTVKDISKADFIQLSDKNGNPVIPGTSWAGAFRSRFKKLSGSPELTEKLFGYADTQNKSQKKSRIVFSESKLKDSSEKLITRTSIDRFSGGVKNKALYSELTRYNGRCRLEIIISNKIPEAEKCMTVLCAVICDLDKGYLSTGGLTSVGRGIFEVEKMELNGKDVTEALRQCDIAKMMEGGIIG